MRLLPSHRQASTGAARSTSRRLGFGRHATPRLLSRRGQSLVELAVTLPILLLLVAGAIDMGRVFFARIAIENAAKEGAVFGAMRPECDDAGSGCSDPATVEWHIKKELGDATITWTAQCLRGGAPVALSACEANDLYRVEVQQQFGLVTPILSGLFGNSINLATSATAVVFADAFSSGPSSPGPSASPNPSENPPGMCLVPELVGLKSNKVDQPWADRGFTGPITKNGGPGTFTVVGQSLIAGTWEPCTSGITVSDEVIPTPTPTPTPSPTPSSSPSAPGSPTPTPTPTPPPTCKLVPALEGFTVEQARQQWTTAGFTGAFTPAQGQNNKTVTKQTTSPPSIPGDCMPPTTTVTVEYSN